MKRRGFVRGVVSGNLKLTRALCLGIALWAAPSADAATFGLGVDPAQSQIQFEGQAAQPLSGRLGVSLSGDGPPVAARAGFDLVALELTGAGLDIGLDSAQANPGLGFLDPDGSFTIPLLYLEIDDGGGPVGLTLLDVVGTFEADGACGASLCLATSLVVDTGPLAGLATVTVVATPEPATGMLVLLGLGAVARARRARKEKVR
ncbi:MAG: PEP-CTERM sorting domain-containing protein [Myxococcota bacterium]